MLHHLYDSISFCKGMEVGVGYTGSNFTNFLATIWGQVLLMTFSYIDVEKSQFFKSLQNSMVCRTEKLDMAAWLSGK